MSATPPVNGRSARTADTDDRNAPTTADFRKGESDYSHFIWQKINNIDSTIARLSESYGRLDTKVDHMSARADKLDAKISTLESDVKAIRESITVMNASSSHYATKTDLHKELRDQTWKIVGIMATIVLAGFGGVYTLIRTLPHQPEVITSISQTTPQQTALPSPPPSVPTQPTPAPARQNKVQ